MKDRSGVVERRKGRVQAEDGPVTKIMDNVTQATSFWCLVILCNE